jgi:hypothetical protein
MLLMRYAVQVPLAVASMFDARLNQDRVTGATPLCTFLTLLTGGYFVTESLIICRNFEEHGVEPLAHAAVCVCFFLLVAFTKKMQWFVPRVLFFECSTPLVHLRWLLQSLGLGETTFYKVNGISMMAAFFVCRVVWGTSASPLFLYIMFARSLLGTTPHMGVWLLDVECFQLLQMHMCTPPRLTSTLWAYLAHLLRILVYGPWRCHRCEIIALAISLHVGASLTRSLPLPGLVLF